MERHVERGAGVGERAAGPVRRDLDRRSGRAARPRAWPRTSARRPPRRASRRRAAAASRREVLDAARAAPGRRCVGRAGQARAEQPERIGALDDRAPQLVVGEGRGGWRRTRRSRRPGSRTRAPARPRAASSSRPGSRRCAPGGRARARPLPSTRRSRCGRRSQRERRRARGASSCAARSARGPRAPRPAARPSPPSAAWRRLPYQLNAACPAIAPGHDEDRAREAVLAQHRERVLEHVAVAVVERERDRGLVGRERQVVDLVEVDDALPAGRERVHLAPEGAGRDRERIALVARCGGSRGCAGRGAARRREPRRPAPGRARAPPWRGRPPASAGELGFRVHRVPLWSRTPLG